MEEHPRPSFPRWPVHAADLQFESCPSLYACQRSRGHGIRERFLVIAFGVTIRQPEAKGTLSALQLVNRKRLGVKRAEPDRFCRPNSTTLATFTQPLSCFVRFLHFFFLLFSCWLRRRIFTFFYFFFFEGSLNVPMLSSEMLFGFLKQCSGRNF